MTYEQYWEECLSSSFDEHGIIATPEQIRAIAKDVELGRENFTLCYPFPENPYPGEIERLKKELIKEREKEVCPVCLGSKRNISYGPCHSASSPCYKCRGEGKI
jgi:hypothetical protein